ncbi:MAG TPA: hypothetical protein VGE37_14655 [Archangium sp.]
MKEIPPFRLVAEPLDEEARSIQGYRWAGEEIGRRHRLGGEPNFMQAEDWPACPGCRQRMSFYAQLDSIGDSVDLGDCGMIYVFVCFDCFETKSILQSG